MTDAILEITDGTTTINLIQPLSGFHVTAWTPAITDYKGGGTFQNPPLANWRQLRDSKRDTAVENFTITLNGSSPDTAAFQLQELRRLLEKANQYWTTDWQNTPVYIAAKMKCETNTRYCFVVKGRLGNDRNFYDQPVIGDVTTLQDLPLVIERRAWLDNIPGNGTAAAISAVETYNGVNYGNVDDFGVRDPKTTEEVFFAIRRNTANITNIHLTTGGANRIGAAPPYDIVNATGETYFGIDTSIANSGPFFSLVFDIGTAGVGGPTLVWELWTGAAWTAIAIFDDGTSDFTNTGVNAIIFSLSSNWTTNSPGGGLPTGYWIRVRVSAGSFSTEPQQQNRDVYSVVWPYTEIQSSIVAGDISALSKLTIKSVSQPGSNGLSRASAVIMGIRSSSRGEDFTAYINLADEQNPTGITITNVASGGKGSFVNSIGAPSGRVFRYSPVGVDPLIQLVKVSISSSLSSSYFGSYRVFCVTNTGFPDDFTLRLDVFDSGADPLYQSDVQPVNSGTGELIDFGIVTIQPLVGIEFNQLDFIIYGSNNNATPGTLSFVHLVLIPIDEYAFETKTTDSSDSARINDNGYLVVNSFAPKIQKSVVLDTTNGLLRRRYQYISNSFDSILQTNAKQRLWFITYYENGGVFISDFRDVFTIQIEKLQRYLSLRGNR